MLLHWIPENERRKILDQLIADDFIMIKVDAVHAAKLGKLRVNLDLTEPGKFIGAIPRSNVQHAIGAINKLNQYDIETAEIPAG